jgi:hypothetical protein
MRLFLISLFSVCMFSLSAQVEVVMDKQELHKGESLHFVISCQTEQDLELTVFTEGHLLLHQNSRLLSGDTPFDIDTKEAVAGKYTVLVTGEKTHIEKEFQILN